MEIAIENELTPAIELSSLEIEALLQCHLFDGDSDKINSFYNNNGTTIEYLISIGFLDKNLKPLRKYYSNDYGRVSREMLQSISLSFERAAERSQEFIENQNTFFFHRRIFISEDVVSEFMSELKEMVENMKVEIVKSNEADTIYEMSTSLSMINGHQLLSSIRDIKAELENAATAILDVPRGKRRSLVTRITVDKAAFDHNMEIINRHIDLFLKKTSICEVRLIPFDFVFYFLPSLL